MPVRQSRLQTGRLVTLIPVPCHRRYHWQQMDSPAPDLEASYDLVAEEYARQFHNELEHKPFDRKMLDWLIEKVDCLGPICDLGCGPGQIVRYLHGRGAAACGIDLSTEMVRSEEHTSELQSLRHLVC